MDRRSAIKNLALALGGTISATTMGVLFESFTVIDNDKNFKLSSSDEEILAELADIIIPTTASSAGAKAAGLGAFIPMMIKDCYPSETQLIFASGLKEMKARCLKEYNKDFLAMTIEERQKLIDSLRLETVANGMKASFYLIARDLTILGYFTSEIGCTQARVYLPIPGSYDGDAAYVPGQKAWATN